MYSFVKDNRTVTLVPLTPRKVYEDQMKLKIKNELKKKKIMRPRVQKKMMKKKVKGKKRE